MPRSIKTSREQAVISETTLARLGSVQIQRRLRLTAQVHQLRYSRLHAIRQFILLDPRQCFGITDLGELLLIQIL